MNKNYYQVLGVPETADEKEIKKAFRKLAKQFHPDTNSGNPEAEKRFKEINEAYAVLGDPKKRKLYDQYGEMAFQEGFDPQAYEAWKKSAGAGGFSGFGQGGPFGGGAYGNGSFGNGGSFHSMHFEGNPDDLNDLFSNLFGQHSGPGGYSGYSGFDSFGSGNSAFGSGGRYDRSGRRKGADLNTEISITFEEAAFGCDKMFALTMPDGKKTSLQVHIPAGIDEGQKVRLKGKGNPGMGGAENGDLFLQVHILPKEGFERKGQDIYVTARIPFVTAALGGEAIVPVLGGNVACKVKAGTQSGSRIRLRGKGIVSMKNPSVCGDEYVIVQIDVPRNLTPEQRRKLEEFAGLTGQGRTPGGHRAA